MTLSTLFFIVAYWQWLLIGVVATAALSYAAFVLRNWKIAVAAGLLIAAGLGGQALYSAGYKAKVDEVVAAQAKILRDRIKLLEEIADDDEARAKADEQRIAELEKQVNETPANSGACLDGDAARRLQRVK